MNGQERGTVEFSIDERGDPALPLSLVRNALAGIARPEVTSALEGLEGPLTAADLAAEGVTLSFDPDALILAITVSPGSMEPVDLGAGQPARKPTGGKKLDPEPFSAILGISFHLDTGLSLTGLADPFSLQCGIGLEPSINVLGFVASADMDLEFSGAASFDLEEAAVLRDLPGWGARLSGGIVDARTVSFQGAAELLGLSLRREDEIPDGRSGRREVLEELILERSAGVTVSMNGTVIRRYRLEAGSYRLSNLPLASGLNDVLVVIEEEGEETRRIRVGAPFDAGILDPGEADYCVAFGVDRDTLSRPFASADFSLGILPGLELGADLEAGLGVVLGGLSGAWASPMGNLDAAAALSIPYEGVSAWIPSFATRLSWRLSLPGLRYFPALGLAAAYRHPGFSPPRKDPAGNSASVWDLSVQVSQRIPGLAGSLGLYGDADIEDGIPDSISLSAGWNLSPSKNVFLSVSGGADWDTETGWKPQASFSLSVVPPTRRSLQFRQDFLAGTNRFDVSMALDEAGKGILGFSGDGLVGDAETGSASLSLQAETDSFGLSASGSCSGTGGGPGALGIRLAASSTLAFAGGLFAAARSFGDAFAILAPAPSVGSESLELRPSGGAVVTSTDGKPALVTGLGLYRTFFASIEMPGSPPDRRLDPAAVEIVPGYRSVTVITVRSASSVAARGRLVDGAGRPLANLVGDLSNGGGTFTDEMGVFECYGLEAGELSIQWSDGSGSRFTVDGSREGAMVELGDLRAEKAAPGGEGSS